VDEWAQRMWISQKEIVLSMNKTQEFMSWTKLEGNQVPKL
jgi:hypothetical protein